MKSKFSRGFTLIELLVVIAIIGVLSAVVLASLNTARSKGNDAGVKANLATVSTQAALYLSDNNNSYGTVSNGVCPASGTVNVFTNATIMSAINAALIVLVVVAPRLVMRRQFPMQWQCRDRQLSHRQPRHTGASITRESVAVSLVL